MGILVTVLWRVSSGTILPIFVEIGSYLTEKEQKISWHSFFLRHSVVLVALTWWVRWTSGHVIIISPLLLLYGESAGHTFDGVRCSTIFVGLSSNANVKNLELNLSLSALGAGGAQVLECHSTRIRNIGSLDISDNGSSLLLLFSLLNSGSSSHNSNNNNNNRATLIYSLENKCHAYAAQTARYHHKVLLKVMCNDIFVPEVPPHHRVKMVK